MELHLFMFIAVFVGTIVQVTAGFSGGTIGTLILSQWLPILESSALITVAVAITCVSMAIEYRKSIQWKLVLPMTPAYAIVFYLCLQLAKQVDTTLLKAWFGAALVVLAIYSAVLSDKLRLKRSGMTGIVCAALSGVISAFFGMGAPPIALYMLAVFEDDKKAYLANCQCVFAINSFTGSLIRMQSGLITQELAPMLITGVLALFLGRAVGKRIVNKLDMPRLHHVVALVMGASGVLTFLTNIK